MKYIDLRQNLADFVIFSLSDIRKIEPGFHRTRLSEWQNKGYIKKIIKEYYIFSDTEINEKVLFLIAQNIYRPSYVSLESALSYHGLIPEGVFSVTSVTSKKSQNLETAVGNFIYKSVKPELMFGYELIESVVGKIKMADPEKAILDYLYLNSDMKEESDFEEWRLNLQILRDNWDQDRYERYLRIFDNKALKERAFELLKFINHA
jgi:predicted transcriptional regulator of viral defense system